MRFTATAGASTFIDLVAPRLVSATLNGAPVDVSGFDESVGLTLNDLAAENELTVVANCAYSNTGEDCIASSTPPTTPCTCIRSSRPPMPSVCSRASISPT